MKKKSGPNKEFWIFVVVFLIVSSIYILQKVDLKKTDQKDYREKTIVETTPVKYKLDSSGQKIPDTYLVIREGFYSKSRNQITLRLLNNADKDIEISRVYFLPGKDEIKKKMIASFEDSYYRYVTRTAPFKVVDKVIKKGQESSLILDLDSLGLKTITGDVWIVPSDVESAFIKGAIDMNKISVISKENIAMLP